jgi:TIR domain
MYVFISYSNLDAEHADRLTAVLRERGIEYFLDRKDIGWGGDIDHAIKVALGRATHFVAIVSPASLISSWTNFELGVVTGISLARGTRIEVLPWLTHPSLIVPLYLRRLHYKSSFEDVANYFKAASDPISRAPYERSRYEWRGARANALRLVGAADEWFPHRCVQIEARDEPYRMPERFLSERADVMRTLQEQASESGALLFNGPHTRLIDYRIGDVDAETEQKHLTLILGPLLWFDYCTVRWFTDAYASENASDKLGKYIDLEEIAHHGIIRNSKLHNILDTVTTIVTSDGFITYSRRSRRVAVAQGLLTSTVAENIHQTLDRSLQKVAPGELPAPFRTVIRGIEEELSPSIGRWVAENTDCLYCLGLSFDLSRFHPDILFLVAVPHTIAELEDACRQEPGKDFIEGHMIAVSIEQDPVALVGALGDDQWTGGGKASVLRSLEFLHAQAGMRGIGLRAVIHLLSHETQSSRE